LESQIAVARLQVQSQVRVQWQESAPEREPPQVPVMTRTGWDSASVRVREAERQRPER